MSLSAALALFLLLAQSPAAAPTEGSVSVDVTPATVNVSIGEKFRVTLTAHGPRGTIFDFPKTVSTGAGDLTLVPALATADSAVYEAQIFALGKDAAIPSVRVPYRSADGTEGGVDTQAAPLNVVSVLDPADKKPAPADFAPPVSVEVTRIFWVFATATVLLAALGFFWLARRLRFPKTVPAPTLIPPVSPEEAALSQLDELARGLSALDVRGFYIEIVQILKQYLERRLGAPVLEMTSTETVGFVRAHEWTTRHAVAIRDLVHAADLVKFGGATAAPDANRLIELVREVVATIDHQRRDEEARRAQEDAMEKKR